MFECNMYSTTSLCVFRRSKMMHSRYMGWLRCTSWRGPWKTDISKHSCIGEVGALILVACAISRLELVRKIRADGVAG